MKKESVLLSQNVTTKFKNLANQYNIDHTKLMEDVLKQSLLELDITNESLCMVCSEVLTNGVCCCCGG